MAVVQFRNEDCLCTMQKFIDKGKKVDIILTSPPYNTARNVKTQKSMDTHNSRYIEYNDNMSNEDYRNWTVQLFENFDKILSPNGVVLYNMSYGSENPMVMVDVLGDINGKTNFLVADIITWKKNSALPNNVSHNKLTRIVEFVFVICRKEEYKTFNANKKITKVGKNGQKYYENIFNFIEAPNNDGSCSLNKATFSSDLCKQLLDIYATSMSIVYDPFMGTGTTAIGCIRFNEGLNNIVCVGSEISKPQVEFSCLRSNKFLEENRYKASIKCYFREEKGAV